MKNTWIVLLFAALILTLGLNACTTPTASRTETVPQTGGQMDELFINMMVPHHEGAVEMARIALVRSQRPEIREMSEAIIASQEEEIGLLRDWKFDWYGTRDTPSMSEMPSMHPMPGHGAAGHGMDMRAEVDALRNAPEPFDLAFIDAMIPHHQSAIDAAEEIKASTGRAELIAMADAIIAAQRQEIDQMLAWRAAWYPDAPALP
jgi:uncharacterized protein (DUF305 family)